MSNKGSRSRDIGAWLRLDRRTTGGSVNLAKWSGKTPANDEGQFAGRLGRVINESDYKLDNQQVFANPSPTLNDLNQCLRIIWEEIKEYSVWPENCWMFCSVIQEHLQSNFGGTFTQGKLQHLELAPAIRSRINQRTQSEYRARTSSAITLSLRTLSMSEELNETSKNYIVSRVLKKTSLAHCRTVGRLCFSVIINRASSRAHISSRNASCLKHLSLVSSLLSQVHPIFLQHPFPDDFTISIAKLAAQLSSCGSSRKSSSYMEACMAYRESASITCILYTRDPAKFAFALARRLHSHGMALHLSELHEEACTAFAKSLPIMRTLYARKPREFGAELSRYLNNYGATLHWLGFYKEAITAYTESISLMRTYHAHEPIKSKGSLAVGLIGLRTCLFALGREAEAVALNDEIATLKRS